MSSTAPTNTSDGVRDFLALVGLVAIGFFVVAVLARLMASSQPKAPEKTESFDNGSVIDGEAVEVVNPAPANHEAAPVSSTALAVVEPIPPLVVATAPVFEHSPDFRVVCANGAQYALTSSESRIVERLWDAKRTGYPEVHQSKLLEDLGICSKRIRDVFKSHKETYQALIGHGKRKGMFFLKAA